jgi:hypothetical protein
MTLTEKVRGQRTMKRILTLVVLIGIAVVLTPACGKKAESYSPTIDPANFAAKIDNQHFPLEPGTTFIYEGQEEGSAQRTEVYISHKTKEILGVTCVEVSDNVSLDGTLVEATLDWYAQDKDGNVWYFGEDSKEYENGQVVSTAGSWEAGLDGAKPGIVMEAAPKIGDSYRQEYYKGEAEDMADVLSLNESTTVRYGSFNNCLKTKDYTALEPGVAENKYFAPGVGNILTVMIEGGSELVSVTAE